MKFTPGEKSKSHAMQRGGVIFRPPPYAFDLGLWYKLGGCRLFDLLVDV